VKAFIRNITFVVSFLLGSAGLVYAQSLSFYQQNSLIFLLITAGLFIVICVISFASGILKRMVEKYVPSSDRYQSELRSNSSPPDEPEVNFYHPGHLRISFPDSPDNINGLRRDSDLVFTLMLEILETIVPEVISEVKNKKQGGEL
jgi:hypothetical protein